MQVNCADEVFDGLKIFIDGEDIEIGEDLGEGSQGYVQKAKLKQTGEDVAVKHYAYDDYYSERIRSEIANLKTATGHEGIVQLLGLYSRSANPRARKGLVLEFCEGGSLDKAIELKEDDDFENNINWIVQIIRAVKHLHDHGIVHRDLKPANILFALTDRKNLKLCDFAECTTLPKDASSIEHTSYRGTPGFRDSEIDAGNDYCDKADVFSLGRTIICILLGLSPERLGLSHFIEMCFSAERDRLESYKKEYSNMDQLDGFNHGEMGASEFLKVFVGGHFELVALAVRMYISDVAERPTMNAVYARLQEILDDHYKTDDNVTYVRKGKMTINPAELQRHLDITTHFGKVMDERQEKIKRMRQSLAEQMHRLDLEPEKPEEELYQMMQELQQMNQEVDQMNIDMHLLKRPVEVLKHDKQKKVDILRHSLNDIMEELAQQPEKTVLETNQMMRRLDVMNKEVDQLMSDMHI